MNAQPEPTNRAELLKLANAVDEALTEEMLRTSFRSTNPDLPSWEEGSRVGTTPPVPQPGIPPQSRAAVDYAVRVLSTGVATAMASGSVALVMAVSQWADPIVCGIVFGAPIGLAVPIAALGSLARRAKDVAQAAPPEIHQHYGGTVYQQHSETHIKTSGVWATTKHNPRSPA